MIEETKYVGNSVIDFSTDYEKKIYEERTHWVVVRGRGKNRVRQTCKTFFDVVDYATQFGDGRTMCYAVNEHNSSAHICNL